MNVSAYTKFIVGAVTAGVVALNSVISDSAVTNNEWVTVALAVLGALGIYALPNTPPKE